MKNAIENPLQPGESEAIERALRQLHAQLQNFLASVPVEAQTPSGLSRHLGVERTTCHRAVAAASHPYTGLDLADQLPGSKGLRLLTEQGRVGNGVSEDLKRSAQALNCAIDEYDRATRVIAGSRTKLMRRIRATSATQSHDGRAEERRETREALATAAAKLTGRFSRLWFALHIYEPGEDPKRVIQTRSNGLLGHFARDNAVPLTFHVFVTHDDETRVRTEHLDQFHPIRPPKGDEPPGLLTEFSTAPTPIVRTKQPGEFLVQTFSDSPDQPRAESVDMVFGMVGGMAHPALSRSQLEEVWALVNFPANRLLFDVFLHRDLARAAIPALDVHLWRPDFASHSGERWQTRFATAPKLELIGSGLHRSQTDAWDRYTELLETLFTTRGIDPADYVGFRCDVPYPIWRAGYCMSFDFGSETNGV